MPTKNTSSPRNGDQIRLKALIKRIHKEGWSWFLRRSLRELRAPTTTFGMRLRPLSKRFVDGWRSSVLQITGLTFGDDAIIDKDALVLFYDLDVSPITFDFVWALAIAEFNRAELGLSSVHVVIVPGLVDGLRREMPDYESIVDASSRRWRLDHIIYAACGLLPSLNGFTFAPSRSHAERLRIAAGERQYPSEYHTALPIPHRVYDGTRLLRQGCSAEILDAPVQARRYVRQWINSVAKDRRIVAITMRDYGYNAGRNSNLPAWRAFALSLDPAQYAAVFVPDTDLALSAMPELEGLVVFPAAAFDIHLRAALYQEAWLNLGVSTGPIALAWFLRSCRYAMFKVQVPGVNVTSDDYFIQSGYTLGGDLPGAKPLQRWIWEDDNFDVIRRVFDEMVIMIEKEERMTRS